MGLPARRTLLLAGALLGLVAAPPAHAQAWVDGPGATQAHSSCAIGANETLTEAVASYFGSPSPPFPKVGEVYYARALIAVLGTPCNGGAHVLPEFVLPPQTVLATSDTHPVRCFYTDLGTRKVDELPRLECPQTPSAGLSGFAFLAPTVASGAFPVPRGYMFEIWVPLLSRKRLNGAATNEYLRTPIRVISDFPYTTFSQVPVVVFENPPSITYPGDPVSSLTDSSVHVQGTLFNHFTPGTAFIDIGRTLSYELPPAGPFAIPEGEGFIVDAGFSALSPGTTYHWRLRFVTSTGTTLLGADQAFTTTGAAGRPGGDGGITSDGGSSPGGGGSPSSGGGADAGANFAPPAGGTGGATGAETSGSPGCHAAPGGPLAVLLGWLALPGLAPGRSRRR